MAGFGILIGACLLYLMVSTSLGTIFSEGLTPNSVSMLSVLGFLGFTAASLHGAAFICLVLAVFIPMFFIN